MLSAYGNDHTFLKVCIPLQEVGVGMKIVYK